MFAIDGKPVVVRFDDTEHTLEEGLALAPQNWEVLYITRHERGWVFVVFAVTYALDNGETGSMRWSQFEESKIINEKLGKPLATIHLQR